jgi:ABC-type transporter Mla subunit MlaD
VGSGVLSAGIATLGGMWASRRPPRKLQDAELAQIAAKMSHDVAEDVRKENQQLETKVDTLQKSVDTLRDRVGELTTALWSAIGRLDSHGADADDLRQILRNGHRLD